MNDKTKGMLINLIEEASEVSQIAAKCLRFGMKSHDQNDRNKTSNQELLGLEIGNFAHITDMLLNSKKINYEHLEAGKEQKKKRLKTYPLYIADGKK